METTKILVNVYGPSEMCSGSDSFGVDANDWETGDYWTYSPQLSLSSISTNPVTVTVIGEGSASLNLFDSRHNPKGVKRIWIGKIPVTSISGPSNTPNMQYANFYANIPTDANPSSYQWILNPQLNNNLYGTTTYHLEVAFYTAGLYQVVCRANNSCGNGEYTAMGVEVY